MNTRVEMPYGDDVIITFYVDQEDELVIKSTWDDIPFILTASRRIDGVYPWIRFYTALDKDGGVRKEVSSRDSDLSWIMTRKDMFRLGVKLAVFAVRCLFARKSRQL
jgi:hypothetical protein